MAEDEMTIGEVGRTVKRIEENMVTKDGYAEVIAGLKLEDARNAGATRDLAEKWENAEKALKSARSAVVNIWFAAVLAVLGSIVVKIWPW